MAYVAAISGVCGVRPTTADGCQNDRCDQDVLAPGFVKVFGIGDSADATPGYRGDPSVQCADEPARASKDDHERGCFTSSCYARGTPLIEPGRVCSQPITVLPQLS